MEEIVFYPTQTKIDATNSFFAYDPYVETFWLKALGPTATLLANHLAFQSLISNRAYKISLIDLSLLLGTGSRSGNNSPAAKQLKRLVANEIIYQIQENEFLVPKCICPMNQLQVSRLDKTNQIEHEKWIERLNISPLSTQRKRIKALMARLDLLESSNSEMLIAIQSCGLHPSIVGEALSHTSISDTVA